MADDGAEVGQARVGRARHQGLQRKRTGLVGGLAGGAELGKKRRAGGANLRIACASEGPRSRESGS